MSKQYTLNEVDAMIAQLQKTKKDSPRVECLKKCKAELEKCLADAGGDENKKSACNKRLNDCISLCPPN